MPKLTPEKAQEKHARRLIDATGDIEAGVNRVTVSPSAKAADKIDKMKANLIRAFDSGKVERRLRSVSVEDWKSKMVGKGIPNIATGVELAKEKTIKFYSELFPYQDRLINEIKGMPDTTLEQNIARATHMMRGMAKFVRKG